ncbi:MAG: TetR/AcrR family transcriptional regulator [Pseudomonadota bacterium]
MVKKAAVSSARRRPGRPRHPVTREQLLAAARTVFAEQGFAAGSMTSVAEQVGIRKASLFHHFASKDALYQEVMTATLLELGQLLARVSDSLTGDFGQRLDLLTRELNAYLGEHLEVTRLLFRDLLFDGPFFAGRGRQLVMQVFQGTVQFFERDMDSGVLPRQDARHLVLTMLGVHFTYWAAEVLRREAFGDTEDGGVLQRAEVVRRQVRWMCGLPA